MKRFIFVRHAESQSNAGLVTAANGDIELTEKGRSQARELAESFDAAPDLIVVSRDLRARQTVEPVIAKFPNSATVEMPVHEFTYLSPQRHVTEIERKHLADDYWTKSDPLYIDGDAAESFASLANRARNFMHDARDLNGDTIFVFTHQQFLSMTLWEILKPGRNIDAEFMSGYKRFYDLADIPNAAKVTVLFDGEVFYSGKIDSSHLLS